MTIQQSYLLGASIELYEHNSMKNKSSYTCYTLVICPVVPRNPIVPVVPRVFLEFPMLNNLNDGRHPSLHQDPSRVPQMIESGVLPGIMAALNKETLKSRSPKSETSPRGDENAKMAKSTKTLSRSGAEGLSFVPGVLASIALHAVTETQSFWIDVTMIDL